MGTLTDFYATDTDRKKAADLINTSTDLLAQEAANNTALQALKTTVKADIANNIYNKQDIINIGGMLALKDNISVQKSNYKAELIALKALANDPTYETEIQAAADLL